MSDPNISPSSSCNGPSEGNSLNSSTVCTETPSLVTEWPAAAVFPYSSNNRQLEFEAKIGI